MRQSPAAAQAAAGGGPKASLRVVSLGADETNRGPTFDMDLSELLQDDGTPIPYDEAPRLLQARPRPQVGTSAPIAHGVTSSGLFQADFFLKLLVLHLFSRVASIGVMLVLGFSCGVCLCRDSCTLPGFPLTHKYNHAPPSWIFIWILEESLRHHSAARSWAAYVAGALVVLAHECGARFADGISMLIASAVPEGKGVSSSAALEVAVMQALSAAHGISLGGRQLALLCQKVRALACRDGR